MNNVIYNMAELAKCDGFDAAGAEKNFESRQAYFDKLTDFASNPRQYLPKYNPTVIIYDATAREDFIAELDKTEKRMSSLGMQLIVSEIDVLREAIAKKDEKALSDGQVKFYAKLEIIANCITSARMPANTALTVPHPYEKPVILAVDDRPEILTTLSSMLDDSFRVIAVTNGDDALRAIEAHLPSLFLLDIEMPMMNGFQLAEKIRENNRYKNTPIIFLTGKASREYVLNAKSHGINDYILKPVDKNLLISKIERRLGPMVRTVGV